MRMLCDGAESPEHGIWTSPDFELRVHDEGKFGERREVAIMEPESAQEFPNALDWVELRAVRREEEQREIGLLSQTPSRVERSMVVLRIVDDDNHASAGPGADSAQVPKERPTGLGIETAGGWKGAQFTITDANGSKIADGFASGSVETDWVFDLWRNPHPTAASVLLEMNLIERPQIDPGIGGQSLEFFLPPLALRDLLAPPPVAVRAGENPDAGKVAGTVARATSRQTASSGRKTAAVRPRAEQGAHNALGNVEGPLPLGSVAWASIATDAPAVLHRRVPRNHPVRTDGPSFAPLVVHRPIALRPPGNSTHVLPARPRAADDRIVLRGCAVSRLAVRGSSPRDPKWSAASWPSSMESATVMRNNL